MKKSTVIFSVFILLLTFSMGAYAATKYNFTFDGKKQSIDVQLINNKAYVPLNDVTELFGGKVTYDSKSKTYAVTSNTKGTSTTQSELSQTIKNVTVKIDKVIQDSDSLKIYVTYVNNTKDAINTSDSLTRIVANGKQYSYNTDFNFKRWYKKDVPHTDSYIEPGVTAENVIFFEPVNADSINIAFTANWEDYRFNNVKITK
ncbi:stalk domain-containing protein [Lysinibacillus xylanilyticus]|uniref:stalk domain-containing protein n=1 Tax=Lysinibacillus xylanilyticus TaxID=582475 RepID=UPI003812609A